MTGAADRPRSRRVVRLIALERERERERGVTLARLLRRRARQSRSLKATAPRESLDELSP